MENELLRSKSPVMYNIGIVRVWGGHDTEQCVYAADCQEGVVEQENGTQLQVHSKSPMYTLICIYSDT